MVVGFPATPIIEARARFCLSAAHTKEMLDKVRVCWLVDRLVACLTSQQHARVSQGRICSDNTNRKHALWLVLMQSVMFL